MTGAERGFLLLTSHLGNPRRDPLTLAQLRILSKRVRSGGRIPEDRDLEGDDFTALGYGSQDAQRMLALLDDEKVLELYLRRQRLAGFDLRTRVSPGYPKELSQRLGDDAPTVLWTLGDVRFLDLPKIALVGSRQVLPKNLEFAQAVGKAAARQGYALVSGNAPGSDQAAQNACLAHGGRVISVVADELERHARRERLLFVSEDSFDLPFHRIRALRRNRIIHALGGCVLVSQCSLGVGGTWDGVTRNLKEGWCPVHCFQDDSRATQELTSRGANPIPMEALDCLDDLIDPDPNFLL